MSENGKRLYKIQTTIYDKSLMEIVFQGYVY